MKKIYLKKVWNVSIWKTKKRKTSKFMMQEVTTGMRDKRLNNMEWIDREEWRRK